MFRASNLKLAKIVRAPSLSNTVRNREIGEKPPLPDPGPALANYSYTLSAAPSQPAPYNTAVKPRPHRRSIRAKTAAANDLITQKNWGGARNRAARTSGSLTMAQCHAILAAAGWANAIGLPFNRMVTIHWERAGISDARAAWATGRFLKLARD
jgi:hypothetical protein